MKNKLVHLLEPKELSDIIGYHKFLKNEGIIKKIYDNNFPISLILYGQPGIGKTTITKLLAKKLLIDFDKIIYLNANFENKKSLLEIKQSNEKVILVIDEIHLFNKNNQELICALLDTNKVIMFATTTNNPYVNLIPPLRSRIQIVELKQDKKEFLNDFYEKIKNIEFKNKFSIRDIEKLLQYENYDIRATIELINLIDNLYNINEISFELLEKIGLFKPKRAGLETSEFHDLKSALQKSIRGSDVDAAIYYLASLIKFDDLQSITRRLVIIAYEDIGLANPNLCLRVAQACDVANQIGLPEARIILSDIVVEMSLSEKSNSGYLAIQKALDYIENEGFAEIPNHLKQNHRFIENANYQSPFDYHNNWVNQRYLPSNIEEKFYIKNNYNQTESKINDNYLNWIKKKKG